MSFRFKTCWIKDFTAYLILCCLCLEVQAQAELFSPSRSLYIQSFEISVNNTIFAIDQNNLLYYSNGQSFSPLTNKNCTQLFIDGNLYVSCSDSCYQITDTTYSPMLHAKASSNERELLLFEDEFYSFYTDSIENSSGKSILLPPNTHDITIENNVIYAATHNGLWIYQNNSWKKYQIPTLPNDGDFTKCCVRNGKILLSDQSKIYFFDPESYDIDEYYLNAKIADLGMDIDGNIWYLSKGNLYYIMRNQTVTNNIKIASVIIDEVESGIQPEYYLTQNKSKVNIIFDHRNLIPSEGSQHYYMMENFDNEWLPIKQENIRYSLSTGKYTFKTKTSVKDVTSYPQQINFKVIPPQDQTWLYILGSIVGLLLLIALFQYFKYQEELIKMKSKIKLLQTQTSLAQTESKLNQISINPHFLFNSLNNIQGLLLDDDKSKARNQLRNFSLMMRQVLDSNESDYITIREDVKFLKQYLELEKMNHNSNFEYQIKIEQSLDQNLLIPPMITQILVENAIIHGMKGKTEKGIISIQYLPTNDKQIVVTVQDNGKGLEHSSQKHSSKGIQILKERLKGVKNAYNIENIEHTGEVVGCKASVIMDPK